MRRVTLVLAAVVLLLVAQEAQATQEVGSAAGPGSLGPECGPQYIQRDFCLEWETCPAPEDLVAFCVALGGEPCPGMTYFIYDAECYDDHSHGDNGAYCWLTTGDPSWVGCHFVRVDD